MCIGGGWVDRVPIPDDKSNIGYFTILQTQNKARSFICLLLAYLTGVDQDGTQEIDTDHQPISFSRMKIT